MTKRKQVCVIGAGVSGLAAAHAFKDQGHDVTVLERSHELGGVWAPHRSYPGIRTQSPKDLYRYTDAAMPETYPEWPSGAQVHGYLESYARDKGLLPLIRFNTRVTGLVRRGQDTGAGIPAGGATADPRAGGWWVETDGAAGPERTGYDFVCVASGVFSERNELTHPGMEAFRDGGGTILHSSEYTDPALVRGRKVVILGFSKSATDVAVNAVQQGAASVTVVYLEPVWRVPYHFAGLINFKRILYCRASEAMFPGWDMSWGEKLRHALTKPLVWANWRALESLLTLQFGLKQLGMRPSQPIENGISCGLSLATEGFFPMLKDGRIKAIQGTIASYSQGGITLSTGDRLDADVAILAVGWKIGVPFLPEDVRRTLTTPDGQFRLYRLAVNPDVPDLGFVGFNSSFATVLTSDVAARWLVRYADGQLARQPSKAEMSGWIDRHLDWRRSVRPAARVYGGLCSAPYHFRYLDDLLADMGAARRRRANPLAETFLPPDADAYRSHLSSVPAYRLEG
ncbi:NAD(P)-binding protein [Microvirga tunisiensis]|uniref:Trimethylamine monooxygenase n=1 Tax=Pannonibacter tanglangensis TaxID=2750084 RepID=A0A7X5F5L1_9HYPH|nr:NAD(P)/FAD-dependent oxidoreductase [Pannonibacter sp. XCT-53]NBN78924.1 NAD(P)-binding protein [Pannonibacter sp. XCT-53]